MKLIFYCPLISLLVLSGCSSIITTDQNASNSKPQSIDSLLQSAPKITLSPFNNSDFLQVDAVFYVAKPNRTAFRVISDLSLSTQWFDRLAKIETLTLIDNNNFVVRSVINPPFPFKNRELITCVHTEFLETQTIIDIDSCTDKLEENGEFVRVEEAKSGWRISETGDGKNALTKVQYQAWIDPAGNVPATFFNQSLKSSTLKSLTALKILIKNADENGSYY